MRRRGGPELTDADLQRLERLGGTPTKIAEAAGIDLIEVERRLKHLSWQRPHCQQDTPV